MLFGTVYLPQGLLLQTAFDISYSWKQESYSMDHCITLLVLHLTGRWIRFYNSENTSNFFSWKWLSTSLPCARKGIDSYVIWELVFLMAVLANCYFIPISLLPLKCACLLYSLSIAHRQLLCSYLTASLFVLPNHSLKLPFLPCLSLED